VHEPRATRPVDVHDADAAAGQARIDAEHAE
jgi:hypothetical protein